MQTGPSCSRNHMQRPTLAQTRLPASLPHPPALTATQHCQSCIWKLQPEDWGFDPRYPHGFFVHFLCLFSVFCLFCYFLFCMLCMLNNSLLQISYQESNNKQ